MAERFEDGDIVRLKGTSMEGTVHVDRYSMAAEEVYVKFPFTPKGTAYNLIDPSSVEKVRRTYTGIIRDDDRVTFRNSFSSVTGKEALSRLSQGMALWADIARVERREEPPYQVVWEQ